MENVSKLQYFTIIYNNNSLCTDLLEQDAYFISKICRRARKARILYDTKLVEKTDFFNPQGAARQT